MTRPTVSSLPTTGAPVAGLLVMALGTLAAGGATVGLTRRGLRVLKIFRRFPAS